MIRKRLRRFREKDTRKLFGTILLGKMLGIVAILVTMKLFAFFFDSAAGATPLQDAASTTDAWVSPINTMWVLVTAFLVFFMQAGFMALEAGFARSRETVNVLMECVFDTCLCGLLYWAIGFAFQFGYGNGFIGHQYFFLHGGGSSYDYGGLFDTHVAFLAFFLFQFAFADTASTVTSGAMVGRTSFKGDIIYSMMVSGIIYPIFGHWVWGPGGWLGNSMGWFASFVNQPGGIVFRDFAGSTVVHTVGGFIALAGAIVLGPRLGRKFKRDGGGPLPPHDLTMGAIGGVILWFGWYGFNPGSTLSGMDFVGIGRVAANTTLAACAGGLTAVLWVYFKS
ncbi:MAG: ammonium transporter, Amt family, partial [Acidimicrobiaceae bacterium]